MGAAMIQSRSSLGIWIRLYRALDLALRIWSIYEYRPIEPFENIDLLTALKVGWIVWGN
jgi:hypothetical protein